MKGKIKQTIKEILMPCELVPDLEAQVTNQIEDLLSTTLNSTLQSILEKVEHERLGYSTSPDFMQGWNNLIDIIRQVVNEEMK